MIFEGIDDMARSKTVTNTTRSVCMLVTTDMKNDPRVARHAETLGSQGVRVVVICPWSQGIEAHEFGTSYEIIRPRSIIRRLLHEVAEKQRLFYRSSSTDSSRQGNYPWIKLVAIAVSFLLTQLTLLGTARKQHAQIYCANDLDTLLVTIIAAGLDRIIVYDSHELWPDMMLAPESVKTIARSIERILIRRADIVMTVNEFIATELESRYSLKHSPQVVYNCPKNDYPLPRTKHYIATKVALYQGLYAPERGLENLIKAADYLLPNIHLVLRGYGIIEQELRSLAKGRRNVQFDKPVKMNDLVFAASKADVGLIPYLPSNLCNYLASPNKLFEYILAGLPVVASNIPFMRKVVLANDIGALFDARDPHSIANAINQSTREHILRRQRANLATVAAKYNWDVESKKLLKAYASLH
jgi:glycosyltransferase involved in cell wall biosynthesis